MLLLILKLCIKKKKKQNKTKRQHKRIVHETMNFGSLNLTKLKKKSKNTTKYHNIFTIPLFLGSDMLFYYFILEKRYTHNIFTINSKWQVVSSFKLGPLLISLFYPLKIPYQVRLVVKLLWFYLFIFLIALWFYFDL